MAPQRGLCRRQIEPHRVPAAVEPFDSARAGAGLDDASIRVPPGEIERARHAEEQRRLLRMDFRTFLGAFVNVPCQILMSGRRVIFRLLAWNPWQYVFFRFLATT